MTFIEYYKRHAGKGVGVFEMRELPARTQNDLARLVIRDDKRIGYMLIPSYKWDENHQYLFEGMQVAYYVRAWHPSIIYSEIHIFGRYIPIPIGLSFWRMKKAVV